MELIIDITHVGEIGDSPIKLTMNDVNKNSTVNMYLNGQHYRVNLEELEKQIKALK